MVKLDERGRPQCPECGSILHPQDSPVVVPDEGSDSVPNRSPILHPIHDVFSGLYCSDDCVLDAFNRGWPEFRCLTHG